MPVVAGVHDPGIRIGLQHIGAALRGTARVCGCPGAATSVAFHVLKNQLVLLLELGLNAAHRLAERDRFLDRLVGQRQPAAAVHHRRRDVVGRDDRVQRRGRGVHHERLVEARVRDRAAAVANVQIRGLRQRGEQLVRRVRREHGRAVVVLGIAAHAVAVAVDRIETRVAVPRFVASARDRPCLEQLLHRDRVVAEPVVGRVRDDAVDRRRVDALVHERIRRNRLSDRRLRELVGMDRADDAATVAQRDVVGRNRAGQRQAVLDRLVAVAVA